MNDLKEQETGLEEEAHFYFVINDFISLCETYGSGCVASKLVKNYPNIADNLLCFLKYYTRVPRIVAE